MNRADRHFVHLIKNENGIRTASSLHALNDTTWHCTNICATMSTYLAFVVNAAKTHPDILPAESFCDALSETSFSHSWRAIQANDRALTILSHLQNSKMLKDAFLDLFHAIMVAIELLFSFRYICIVFGTFIPRKTYNCLKILELYIVIWRLNVDAIQLGELLVEDFVYFLAPMFCLSLSLQVGHILLSDTRFILITKLALNVLNLLAKEVFALLLVEVATSLVFNLAFKFHQFDDVVGKLNGLLQSSWFCRAGEELIFLLSCER